MILHIPHSSTTIPSDIVFEHDISLDIERMTDWETDLLFSYSATDQIIFPYSRLFCDVERFIENEPMETSGHGICYTNDSFGNPLRYVSTEERNHIIQNYYYPHHLKLAQSCNLALSLCNTVVIVDCHSFSNEVLPHESDSARPDFCIGTDQFHTPFELVEDIKTLLTLNQYDVLVDRPFSGTIVPINHYHKTKNLKSIMIEVNRKLYRNSDFDKTKQTINKILNLINIYETVR